MNANQFPVHLEHTINQFKEAAQLLGQLGFVVFGHVAFYASDGQHFTTVIEANLEPAEPVLKHQVGHAFDDAVRHLSVKWGELTRGTDLEVSVDHPRSYDDLTLNPNLEGSFNHMRSSILPQPRDLFGATPLGAEGGPEEEQRKMAAAAAGS